jgi:hypothetical protein
MRKTEFITEDPKLKKEIIDVVKATDDLTILQRTLNVLKAGNIDDRIKSVIGQDGDAQQFLKHIIKSILGIEAPIEEKNAFLDRYAKGSVIATDKLLDGKLYSFSELVGTGFTLELFKQLSVELTSQGVGPGEVALAVLSPNIQWSGRISGGGDIVVNKKAVEVKARASKGGRWINARKAKLDLGAIASTITENSVSPIDLPDRINASHWVDTFRPNINPRKLKDVAKKIADSTFKFVDNSSYRDALIAGDASAVVNSYLEVGYDNYKKYSAFAGMLLMDIPTEQMQYFIEYKDMQGSISVSTTYIFAPESEMMPQVILAPGAGPIRAGKFKSDTSAIATAKTVKDRQKKVTDYAKKICDHYGVTDPNTRARVAEVIMADLQHGVDPAKIPTRLMKVFPELGARKKTTTGVAQPGVQPAEPEETPDEITSDNPDMPTRGRRTPNAVQRARR